MRRLSISLLIVVLLATVGFGWTIDRLFFELQPDEADRMAPYRAMGEALAGSSAAGADLSSLVASWPPESRIQLGTFDLNALALPEPLRENFSNGESLAIEADDGVTLFVPVEGSDTALALMLPPQSTQAEAALRIALTVLFYAGIVVLIQGSKFFWSREFVSTSTFGSIQFDPKYRNRI